MATGSENNEDLESIVFAKAPSLLNESKHSLRVLVTGRTGTGKSALVNSVIGDYVAEEGDSADRTTTEVTPYEKKIGKIDVIIYDSPGLQDRVQDKDRYLQDLEEKCKEIHLNLYCVKMDDTLRPGEIDAIKELSNAFGLDEFWRNSSIVLTFANEVTPPKSQSISPDTHFSKRMLAWKHHLRRVLIDEAKISEKMAENVPIVPAGYSDKLSLPAAKCDDWLRELWIKCLDRTEDIAKPILLNINWKQLRNSEEVKKEDITKKKGHEQSISPPDATEKGQERVKVND